MLEEWTAMKAAAKRFVKVHDAYFSTEIDISPLGQLRLRFIPIIAFRNASLFDFTLTYEKASSSSQEEVLLADSVTLLETLPESFQFAVKPCDDSDQIGADVPTFKLILSDNFPKLQTISEPRGGFKVHLKERSSTAAHFEIEVVVPIVVRNLTPLSLLLKEETSNTGAKPVVVGSQQILPLPIQSSLVAPALISLGESERCFSLLNGFLKMDELNRLSFSGSWTVPFSLGKFLDTNLTLKGADGFYRRLNLVVQNEVVGAENLTVITVRYKIIYFLFYKKCSSSSHSMQAQVRGLQLD